jgi:LacI family transcriptional regulator
MHKREVTIYDLANKLKLSTATISRALNNDPAVSKKTLKTIMDAARELGYQRNTFASSLRSQKTYTLGVLVHELKSNFITSVLAGIEKVTASAGYDLLIAHSSESYEKEVANVKNLFHKRIDGLIASLSIATTQFDHFDVFKEKEVPVIFFDRVEETGNHTKVVIDNYQCGYQATRHLIEQGCKRIVLVTGSHQRNVYARRHEGYASALAEAGIPYNKAFVLIKNLNEECGQDTAREILRMPERPDGLFITNDYTAAICMRELKEQGVRIPEDMAIVGFNDDIICQIATPQLTTIRYPGMEIGETAARQLIDLLADNAPLRPGKTIIIPSELIIRNSSKRI